MLNIHVTICDRPYRLKVKPEEEETVRKAARIIAEKIKELQNLHSGSDKQDYLAMAMLTMTSDASLASVGPCPFPLPFSRGLARASGRKGIL